MRSDADRGGRHLDADAEQLEEALLGRPEGLPHLAAVGVGGVQGIHNSGSQILQDQVAELTQAPSHRPVQEGWLGSHLPQVDCIVVHLLLLPSEGALQLHELRVPAADGQRSVSLKRIVCSLSPQCSAMMRDSKPARTSTRLAALT